jgi:hypothetical protein
MERSTVTNRAELGVALACIASLIAGCGSPSAPTDQPAAAAPVAQPESTPAQEAAPVSAPADLPFAAPAEQVSGNATPVEVAPAPARPDSTPPAPPAATPAPPDTSPPSVATPPTPAPAASPSPAPAASAAAPAAAAAPATVAAPTPAVVDKGGAVAVAATKPGLSRVGNDNCETCHDVQFASWSESAHAARKPPLDCESCHGPGSEYSKNAVMKDPAKARAAGLVIPDRAFCSNCHTKGVTDEFLRKAHAHEE